jgi:hypothetical protein
MGFYSPAVLVEDAQRHGLRIKSIDIQTSDWPCTIEPGQDGSLSLRLGLNHVEDLRKKSAEALVQSCMQEGAFRSAEDLAKRFPPLTKEELQKDLPRLERSIRSKVSNIVVMRSDNRAGWKAGRTTLQPTKRVATRRIRNPPARPDDYRRAPGRRLCWHWAYD